MPIHSNKDNILRYLEGRIQHFYTIDGGVRESRGSPHITIGDLDMLKFYGIESRLRREANSGNPVPDATELYNGIKVPESRLSVHVTDDTHRFRFTLVNSRWEVAMETKTTGQKYVVDTNQIMVPKNGHIWSFCEDVRLLFRAKGIYDEERWAMLMQVLCRHGPGSTPPPILALIQRNCQGTGYEVWPSVGQNLINLNGTKPNYRNGLPTITVHAGLGKRNADSLTNLFAKTPIAFTRINVVIMKGNTTLHEVKTPALRFVKTRSINNRVFTNNSLKGQSWSVAIGMSKLVEFKNFVELSKAFRGVNLFKQTIGRAINNGAFTNRFMSEEAPRLNRHIRLFVTMKGQMHSKSAVHVNNTQLAHFKHKLLNGSRVNKNSIDIRQHYTPVPPPPLRQPKGNGNGCRNRKKSRGAP